MKEKKDTLIEKMKALGKRNRFLILLLSICLIMTSLPNQYYRTFALAASMPDDGGQYEILSVSELPEDIKLQTVDVGTPLEALELPDSLTVSYRQNVEESQKTQEESEEDVSLTDADVYIKEASVEVSGESAGLGTSVEPEASVEPELSVEPETPIESEPTAEPGTPTEPELTAEPDSSVEPELPIESEPAEDAGTEPEKPEEILQAVIEGVTWESTPEYDMEKEGTYIFAPVLPDGYLLSENVVLPEIVVTAESEEDGTKGKRREKPDSIDEERILFAEDEERILFADEDEETGIIRIPAGQNETWDARTLSDGTVVVEENAVLTVTGCVAISGNVTITGGGTIQRGAAAAYFNVPSGGNLILGNVTVDGKSVSSMYSMIQVSSGNLTLEDGCIVQNCTRSASGGAILLSQSNAVLKRATIQGCTSTFQGGAIYMVGSNVDIHGTTFENCSVGSGASSDQGGALYIYNGCKVDINGAVFRGCSAKGSGRRSAGGGFYAHTGNAIDIRDTVMENCSAGTQGGAFLSYASMVNVYSGVYRNNRTTSIEDVHGNTGGGCFYNCTGTLNIYGGSFLNNYAINKGGCINHCWEPGTITNITGGIFEGNYCDYKDAGADYSGSGGIFNSSVKNGQAELNVSGNVKFGGNGTEGSGVDGIYLDQQSGEPRKIFISTTLTYPVELYVKAVEGYVIAEGRDGYTFLHERDMKKIKFIDIGGSGKTWYAKLSDDKRKVVLTETDPGYKYFVYYISNGAQGNVVDDRQYNEGDEATVQSDKDEQGQDILTYEGHTFRGWSKNADGSGRLYKEGDSLGKMTEDINLYAVFAENLVADFYSGSAGYRVSEEAASVDDSGKGKIEAPELEELDDAENPDDMEGWEKAGWAEKDGEFNFVHQPGDEIVLEDNEEFCGIYKKDVTLAYDKNGWDITLPSADVQQRYARVYDQISYEPAEFTVAPDVSFGDYVFAGWNTEPDGSGDDYYHEGDKISSEKDVTLYAIFTKTLQADFYSGGAGQKETKTAHVRQGRTEPIKAPELKDMEGWSKIGWTEDETRFQADFAAGKEITLTQHSVYYGVYRKDVILSYDLNGGGGSLDSVANSCYANVHSKVEYQPAKFTTAGKPAREGYVFVGWSTEADSIGTNYGENKEISLTEDTTLYARWVIARAGYRVEHYKQELDGSYLLDAAEEAEAVIGDEVSAKAKTYTGFTENAAHELRAGSGIVAADGSLVLKLYYDRDIYEVDFDLNGAEGEAPGKQNVLYGDYVREVDEPVRRGYHFKGWFMDDQGMEGNQWDFDLPVEKNYSGTAKDSSEPRKVTLYAKWVDETAPVLEASSFNQGYISILDWVVRKKSLVITVPIFEEGSGVRQLDYKVSAAVGGSPAKPAGNGTVLPQANERSDAASMQSDEKADGKVAKDETGTIWIPEGRKGIELLYGVLTPNQGGFAAGKVQLLMKGGQTFAKITVSEDFKGNIILACTDNAGNISSERAIQAQEGGIIVEDNAPEIAFSSPDGKLSKTFSRAVDVNVEVMDDADGKGNQRVTGGIASVAYQLDKGKKISVAEDVFGRDIVESYEFDVEVSGAGRHVLRVTAVDNAGNTNTGRVEVNIKEKQRKITVNTPTDAPPQPKAPAGSEPKTGDSMNVQVYATLAMIAGLSYLLLYFASDSPGITEREKEELVSRLVRWAKKGGTVRKLLSFAALFFFLLYYHSIGKSVDVEWDWKETWQ